MGFKPPFPDYEPVRRNPSKKVAPFDPEQDEVKRTGRSQPSREEGFAHPAWADRVETVPPLVVADAAPAATSAPAVLPRKESILKHGHSVTFIGLFLFTAMVFFRPYELSPSLMWLSSTAFWIAVVTILTFALTQLGLEGTLTARPREVNLVLLLVIAGALSIPLALEPLKAFNSYTEYLKVVAIFIIIVNVVRTQRRMNLLWILILCASLVLSYGAINDYRLGRFGLQDQRIKGMIGGLFDNPNDLALHLVTMIPIALIFFFRSRNPVIKLLSLATSVVLLGGVVSTFSRGGFLGLMVAGVVFLWKLGKRMRWLIPPLALAAVLGFVIFAPGDYRTRLSTTQDDSARARFDDLKRSLYVTIRHPVVGVGMDNYILFSNSNKATHNAYTQVSAEMGIPAAVVYILFLITALKHLWKIERAEVGNKKSREFYYAAILLQASLAGYMVASFFASVAFLWYIYYLVGYVVCTQRLYESAKAKAAAKEEESPFHPAFQ